MTARKAVFSLIAGLAIASLVPTAAFAQYEKDAVVTVMRNNQTQLGLAKDASGKNDLLAAGVALADIARGMYSIKKFVPYKGDKASWDKSIDAVVMAALKGAGAAATGDKAGVDAAIAELRRLNALGHSAHK